VLSVCNEIPHVFYTIASLREELPDHCDYEIIVVNNSSTDTFKVGKDENTLEECLTNFGMVKHMEEIKHIRYDGKLSHWCAKNKGIEEAKGRNIFFLDAHCIVGKNSLKNQIEFLDNFKGKIGGVHCYHHPMLMSFKTFDHDCRKIRWLYRFRRVVNKDIPKKPYEVAHMSTCGMMCPKSIFDELGGWNKNFGTRWGGEAYMNLKHGTCGYPHYVHPKSNYYHLKHGYGYSFDGESGRKNPMIAAYTIGGDEWLDTITKGICDKKGITDKPNAYTRMADWVRGSCKEDREFIASKQIMTLSEFYKSKGMV